jgi:hypothetical protein
VPNTNDYNIDPGFSSLDTTVPGLVAGDTIVGVSTDGQSYTSVDGDDPGTVEGTYVSYTVQSDGQITATLIDGPEATIDDINANDFETVGASGPLTDTLYYEVEHASGQITTDSVVNELSDIDFTEGGSPPFFGTTSAPTGATVGVGINGPLEMTVPDGSGQSSDPQVSLTFSTFNADNGSVNEAMGSGLSITTSSGDGVSVDSEAGSLTVSGAEQAVNADLASLTFTAPTTAGSYVLTGGGSAGALDTTDGQSTGLETFDVSQPTPFGYFVSQSFTAGGGYEGTDASGDQPVYAISLTGDFSDPSHYVLVPTDGSLSGAAVGTYLSFQFDQAGDDLVTVNGSGQDLIDEINANAVSGSSTPLSGSIYYETGGPGGAVHELSWDLHDLDFGRSDGAPFTTAGQAVEGQAASLAGLDTTIEASSDESVPDLQVTFSQFNSNGSDPGVFNVDPDVAASLGDVQVVDNGSADLSLSGPEGDVNQLLQTLTFTAPAAATYYINEDGAAEPPGESGYTADSYNDIAVATFDVAPCYCPGTLILTDRGEVAVERLSIGDRLVTGSGEAKPLKWIGRRSYQGRFIASNRRLLPVCIKAGAMGSGLPRRDLWVSPLHAMVVDGCLVPAGALVNGVSVVQASEVEEVRYIHLELAEHSVIYAEGAASESFVDDDSRAMFQNAHTFAELYPDARSVPAVYCLPRVEDGEALERLRAVVDGHAGLGRAAHAAPGLKGSLDRAEAGRVEGWAQAEGHPEAPVCLDVLVDGVMAATVLANRHRPDLERAGLGSGRHAFSLALDLPPGAEVEVRRSLDGRLLGRRAGAWAA